MIASKRVKRGKATNKTAKSTISTTNNIELIPLDIVTID